MKISLKWLNKYCDVSDYISKPEELAALLTRAGIEVEAFTDLGKTFANVVVGHIKKLDKHPNADKLTVCQVEVGNGEVRQIVCAAKNHKLGDKVVAALVGAVLPGDFKIKLSKIRDVESQGMLCSTEELGLGAGADGILLLDANAKVGMSFAEHYGLNDVMFELGITPNRADCLSHLGVARELSCLLSRAFKAPAAQIKAGKESTKKTLQLEVKNNDWCPRYTGRLISGVKIGPSPAWLTQSLNKIGVKSINNVVDVTNYILFDLGQPLHAFDLEQVQGKKLTVANSLKGEKFKSFDGTEITLTGDELTIRDQNRAVALAGVVGGLNSGITDSTKNIFLESAFFNSANNRRTSRRLGIQTDSSYRFSRGVNPEGVLEALNLACQLIVEVAGGEVANDFYDHYPQPMKPASVVARKSYFEERLGYAVNSKDLQTWLERLGCLVKETKKDEVWTVTAPLFRGDLLNEIDLVEEYCRLHGYENIPEILPTLSYEPTAHSEEYVHEKKTTTLFCEQGFLQSYNFGFINDKFQQDFLGAQGSEAKTGLFSVTEVVKVRNPISDEFNVMKTSLVPGLWTNLLHNYRHGQSLGRLFEVSRVFFKNEKGYGQNMHLAGIAWGQKDLLWQKDQTRPVFFDLKTAIEAVLESLNIASFKWEKLQAADVPKFLHPGKAMSLVCEGRAIGIVGGLHPELLDSAKIRQDVAVFEIDVKKLMRGQPKTIKAKVIAKFPSVTRDFSFVLNTETQVAQVITELKKAAGPVLQNVEIFDLFKGEKIGAGKHSVGFRLTYQDGEGTLTEEKLTKLQEALTSKVAQKFGLELRN